MCRSDETGSWSDGTGIAGNLMEVMKKAGIQCVPDESLDTDTRIVELPENPEYAFQVLYSIKINDRSLIFCLASALGEILLHRLNFAKETN